eukprot:m.185961 g.185961  ORF g.185961 m.185961 type:complete len:472 (-) comp24749_c1_seq5:23-1438(-)
MASRVSPVPRRDSLLVGDGAPDGGADGAPTSRVSFAEEGGASGDMVPRRDSLLTTDYRGHHQRGAPAASEYAAQAVVDPTKAPVRGDADWVDEYGFVGVNDGRRRATMARRSTAANPWNSVRNQSVRMKKVPTSEVVQMLDYAARQRAWYCLDMGRDNAVAMLENLQDMLPDGAFVVSNSRREFAMLTFISKGNMTTVPMDADFKGVWLKLAGVKSTPRFKTLTDLINHYAAKKHKGMPCKLETASLEQVLEQVSSSDWLPPDAEADQADFVDPSLRVGALANPGYSAAAAAAVRDGGMINPGYVGAGVPASSAPGSGYAMVDPAESEGFIQISQKSFTCDDGVCGVTFQPCQKDQWFFMGLSNILQNHHGRRDRHYDDMDYSIGVMGHGKATARENEDEVGPYIDYKPADTFTIQVLPKKKRVEFAKNKKVFHTSALPPDKLPLWALQAFHPINGSQLLIQGSNWIYKFK